MLSYKLHVTTKQREKFLNIFIDNFNKNLLNLLKTYTITNKEKNIHCNLSMKTMKYKSCTCIQI